MTELFAGYPALGMWVRFDVAPNPRNGKAEALNVTLLPKEEAEKERTWATTEPVRPEDVRY